MSWCRHSTAGRASYPTGQGTSASAGTGRCGPPPRNGLRQRPWPPGVGPSWGDDQGSRRQHGQLDLERYTSNNGRHLVGVDPHGELQGVAEDVLFQIEVAIEEMVAREEAHSYLFVRETLRFADRVLLEGFNVFSSRMTKLCAIHAEAVEAHAARQKSHGCSLLGDVAVGWARCACCFCVTGSSQPRHHKAGHRLTGTASGIPGRRTGDD
mgnify:CR=1 FL=1